MGKHIHYVFAGAAFFLLAMVLGLGISNSVVRAQTGNREMAQFPAAMMAKGGVLSSVGGSCGQAIAAAQQAIQQVASNCSEKTVCSNQNSNETPKTCSGSISKHLGDYNIGKVAVIKDAKAGKDNLTGGFAAKAASQIVYAKVLSDTVTAAEVTVAVAAAEKSGAQEILVDASAGTSALVEKASENLPVKKVSDFENCYQPDNCVADIAAQISAAKKVATIEVSPLAEKTAFSQAMGAKLVDARTLTVAAAPADQITAAAEVAAAMPAVATALKAENVDTAIVSATDQEALAVESALAKMGIKTIIASDYKCQPTVPSTPAAPTVPAAPTAPAAAAK